MNLVLMGLRASGKSTLGAAVAERFNRPFIDLDRAVLQRLGAPTVAEAWRSAGEPAFRETEADALREALEGDRVVIALGGGAPTAPGAADLLRAHRDAGDAMIVYLRAQPEALRGRMRADDASRNRPSLTGADPIAEVDTVFVQRDPMYTDLASHVLDASAPARDTLDAVCELLIGW